MKRLTYFLILLLISAQVQDAWAAASVLPPAPLADDGDEYLPAQRRVREEGPSSGQGPMFLGLKRQTADFPLVQGGVPSKWNLTTRFAPPPLDVFMSLQI